MEYLNLGINSLSGPIPPQALTLPSLGVLILNENEFSGSIPSRIGNLQHLTYLNLYNNRLSGNLPAQLGELTRLEFLAISANQMSGTIPAALGDLRRLRLLYLGQNQLVGQIPGRLGNLAQLELLELHRNKLSGPIPPALGNLRRIRRIDLSDNQLSGRIPAHLGSLVELERIRLGGNRLIGCIPTGLTGIAGNDFAATGLPTCLKDLPDLDIYPGVLHAATDGGASGRDFVLRVDDDVHLITVGPSPGLPVLQFVDSENNPLPDADPRRFGHQIPFTDTEVEILIIADAGSGSGKASYQLLIQRGFPARFIVTDNQFFSDPGNENLKHNIPDLEVTFEDRSLRAGFLTHFRRTGGFERWGYPTSEVMILEPNTLTQFFQRGALDFHDVGGGWMVERRLAWDYFGGGEGGSPDLGAEEGVTNPNPGAVTGPWGHKVSNFAIDGTYVGFADFFRQFGGVAAFGFPKTDARKDSNTDGTLHVEAYTSGFIRQYFQAAVLEHHPSDQRAPVKLALLGDDLRSRLVPGWETESAFAAAEALRVDSSFLPELTAPARQFKSAARLFEFTDISAGREHNCAITVPGEIICWGANREFAGDDRG